MSKIAFAFLLIHLSQLAAQLMDCNSCLASTPNVNEPSTVKYKFFEPSYHIISREYATACKTRAALLRCLGGTFKSCIDDDPKTMVGIAFLTHICEGVYPIRVALLHFIEENFQTAVQDCKGPGVTRDVLVECVYVFALEAMHPPSGRQQLRKILGAIWKYIQNNKNELKFYP